MEEKLISIIVPCFNEQEVIHMTHSRLSALELKGYRREIIYIDDGSSDDTQKCLREIAEDDGVKVLSFSRNFGHQTAVTAGIDAAEGDALVIIDADLQDPPEAIPRMIEKWEEGYDVVYGKRTHRAGETFFKKVTAWGYYRVLRALGGSYIPKDTGDFRLIDKKVADVLRNDMREHNRFLRGMTAWAGFSQCPVEYERDARAAGETKYTLKKMFKLAADGITAFSAKPLMLPLYLGVAVMLLALVYLIVSVVLGALGKWPVFHVLFAGVFLLAGMGFVFLGIMGMYLSRIYDEAKGRPEYILKSDRERRS